MMKQFRRGVFETNSSSVHSLTMCMKSDFDKWVNGELVWDRYKHKLVAITPETKPPISADYYHRYLSYDQFNDWNYIEFETFEDTFVTPHNEEVVGFGYYGHD